MDFSSVTSVEVQELNNMKIYILGEASFKN